jgi:hypothetical protein
MLVLLLGMCRNTTSKDDQEDEKKPKPVPYIPIWHFPISTLGSEQTLARCLR